MQNRTWNKLLEFETRDLVERFIKRKHNRDATTRQILEITSNFIQAKEYFVNSQRAAISVKPLLQYYGVISMTRGLILALNPKLSESSLKPSHGLEAKGWRENLSNKDFAHLTIAIKNGTFYELLKATENSSYLKNNSSGVSWKLPTDLPAIDSQIKLVDLIRTLSDFSQEYETWTQERLYFTQLEMFKPFAETNEYEYKVGRYLKHPSEISNIFTEEDFEIVSINGNTIRTKNSMIPQFSQRFSDNFNSGIGEIVLTKPINKDVHLNTLCQFYALSYFMGMLSRYYPSVWISLGRTEKGDAIYPLFIKALEFIENHFPITVLEFLQGPYDFEKKNGN